MNILNKKFVDKLDFIIVGTQKGGTTALDNYLRDVKIMALGKKKELHFFDTDKYFINDEIVNVQKLHKLIINNKNIEIRGECTPIYMYWKDAIKRIYKYNKNIKIIAILRNPVYRAFSHWNMEFDRNNEKLLFFEALKAEEQRLSKSQPINYRLYSYIDRGFYYEQINNIYHYFDKKNVLIIKYENFKSNQENVLNSILNFLDIEFRFHNLKVISSHKRKYKHKLTFEEWNYAYSKLSENINKVEQLLNWDCSDWKEYNG